MKSIGVEVIITEWALQAYLDLKAKNVFTTGDYKNTLRPDAELLKNDYPANPRFSNSRFWGPVTDRAGNVLRSGYKMKWRNLGPGSVQLRLCVAILDKAYLCQAFVKTSPSKDKREAAKLKTYINCISIGHYQFRGRL